MYVFVLILILITDNNDRRIVRYESPGYPSQALCQQYRDAMMISLAQREDINGLFIELCSIKL